MSELSCSVDAMPLYGDEPSRVSRIIRQDLLDPDDDGRWDLLEEDERRVLRLLAEDVLHADSSQETLELNDFECHELFTLLREPWSGLLGERNAQTVEFASERDYADLISRHRLPGTPLANIIGTLPIPSILRSDVVVDCPLEIRDAVVAYFFVP